MFKKHRWLFPSLLAISIGLVFTFFYGYKFNPFASSKKDVATYKAEKGKFLIKLPATGELKAVKAVTIGGPAVQRFQIQIAKLAPEGSFIKKGALLIEFDTKELLKALAESEAEYKKAVQEIEKRSASLETEKKALEVELTKAEFALQKAKVLAEADETIMSKHELMKARLDKAQSEIEVQQIKDKIKSKEKEWKAEVEILQVAKRKAEASLTQARQALESMTVKAPDDGIVIYREIWRGGGAPSKIQVGDTVWPGMSLVDLPDLSTMEVIAQVNEADAGLVKVGQKAIVHIDAYPEPEFHGTIKRIASLAKKKDFNSPVKIVEATLSLDKTDPIMKPGLTTKVNILVEELADVVSIPQEAVFERNDKFIVYLMNGKGPAEKVIKLGKRNATHVVVADGLHSGDLVALTDPTRKEELPEKPKK